MHKYHQTAFKNLLIFIYLKCHSRILLHPVLKKQNQNVHSLLLC